METEGVCMNYSIDFSRYDIPDYYRKQLAGYILKGECPCSFLSKVLRGCICSILIADSQGEASFKQIVRFLFNELHPAIWGTPEKFDKHIESVKTLNN